MSRLLRYLIRSSPHATGLTSSIKRGLYLVTLSTTPSSSWRPPAQLLPWPEVTCACWKAQLISSCITRRHPLPWGRGCHGLDQVSHFLLPYMKSWHLPLVAFVFPSQDTYLEAFPPPPFSTFFFIISYIKQVSPSLFSLPPSFPSSHRIIKSPSRLSSPYHFKWIEKRSNFLPLCLPDAEFQNERKVLFPLPFVFTLPLA